MVGSMAAPALTAHKKVHRSSFISPGVSYLPQGIVGKARVYRSEAAWGIGARLYVQKGRSSYRGSKELPLRSTAQKPKAARA